MHPGEYNKRAYEAGRARQMTEIAVRQERAPTVLTNEQLQYIASTEFVPTGLRGNLPAILACVATGRALGLDDMTAIRSIHIIDGKATFSAELMAQLVRRQGHSIQGDVGDGSATVVGKRADNGDTMTVTWTLAMAERAGLAGKGNWKKYPEAMLWARGVSQLCRMLFADCFAGATYTTEELGAEDTGPDGAPAVEAEGVSKSVAAPVAGHAASPSGHEPVEASGGSPSSSTAEPDNWFPPAHQPTPGMGPPAEATEQQKRKLDVMVAKLRTPGHITTEHLYKAWDPAGRHDWERDADGQLHWSDLRGLLTKTEASDLIERLTAFEETIGA